jgi:hypothetical protein
MGGIVNNNRALPSVKKAWDLTHITKEGADHPLRLTPDRSVGQRATYVPAHRSGAEAHGYRHMNTSESDATVHRGQTLHVELGRDRTREQGNQLKSGKPITNLLHAESTPSQKPGEAFTA